MVFSEDPDTGQIRSQTVSFADREANADIIDRLDDLAGMSSDDFVDSLPDGVYYVYDRRD